MECCPFPKVCHLTILVTEDQKFPIISCQWENLLRPYQYNLKVR